MIRKIEILDINNFLTSLNNFKATSHNLDFPSPPKTDAIYRPNSEEIGIEHTTLILDPMSKGGDSQRAVAKWANKALNLLRRKLKELSFNSLDLTIAFNYQALKKGIDMDASVAKMVSLIEDFRNCEDGRPIRYQKPYSEDIPNGVYTFQITHNDGTSVARISHMFTTSESIQLEPLIDDAIERKKSKSAIYKEYCDELWLLIVHPEPMFAPIWELSDDYEIKQKDKAEFDKVFLYNRISQSYKEF